jgi:CubicO group peptidase (beta-lactamase class C family)
MQTENQYKHKIKGFVKPGFEFALQKFEELYEQGHDTRSQLCVYVGHECVINLYGGVSEQSKTFIYSNGKTVSAIMLARLYEQGLFQYEDPIAKYWPEFAQNGKENITIADLMRHEAGMPKIGDKALHFNEMTTEAIKNNSIGKIIEDMKPFWPKESKREYHSMSRDWISNELFRRIEPQGRTYGEYLRQEISPLLKEQIILGATEEEMKDVVEPKSQGFFKTFKDLW